MCCYRCVRKCPQNVILTCVGILQIIVAIIGSGGLLSDSLLKVSGEATNDSLGYFYARYEMGITRFGLRVRQSSPNGTMSQTKLYVSYDESYNDVCVSNDLTDEPYCKVFKIFKIVADTYYIVASIVICLLFYSGIYCLILACCRRLCCRRVFPKSKPNDSESMDSENSGDIITLLKPTDSVGDGDVELRLTTGDFQQNTVINATQTSIDDDDDDDDDPTSQHWCVQCCRCVCSCFSDFGIAIIDLIGAVVFALGFVIWIACKLVNLDPLLTDLTNEYSDETGFEFEWNLLKAGGSVGCFMTVCIMCLILFLSLFCSALCTVCCKFCECCGYLVGLCCDCCKARDSLSISKDHKNSEMFRESLLPTDADSQPAGATVVM